MIVRWASDGRFGRRVIAQGFALGVFMGSDDDSVRVVRDADGKPVGEWRLVAVPISPEERRAMLEGPSVGSVGSPGGGENQFAGTCGTDAPGSSCSFLSSGVKFLDEAGMQELNEEYQRLCEQEMAVFVKAGQDLLSRWVSELNEEKPGSGLTVGVDQGLGPSVGGVSVVGPGQSYSFITPSPEIEAQVDMMRRFRQKCECELLGVVPGVGLPKGVEVVREGVTASEVRSMAVNTPRAVLRSGPRSPEFAWIDNYEVVVRPDLTTDECIALADATWERIRGACPTLEEVFGPDEPGFWWVRGTDWVWDDAIREDWARRCQLESQGSAEEQAEMMRRAESMLLRSGCGWNEDQLVELSAVLEEESPVLSALEAALAGIGGHFPALWCGEVPLLGGWRSSWTWDDWRAGVVEVNGEGETLREQWVPRVAVPAPSIGAQLGALGGPWPVIEPGFMEQSLWLTAWDRMIGLGVRWSAMVRDSQEWMVPGAGTIPDADWEQDRAFRAWMMNPPRYEFGGYRVDRLEGGA